MESLQANYDPFILLQKMVAAASDEVVQMGIFHPGYLDHYILTHSSLLQERCLEVEVLTKPATKNFLEQAGVVLIDYRDL
jgi:predicted glycoside hydrolase/deacetylase ChbG (UPF0249 family)